MSLNFSTGNYKSNKLAQGGNMTCSKGFMSGLNNNVSKDAVVLESANCGAITLNEDIYNLKKGTVLSNLCECEDVTGVPGKTLSCPSGKFINTFYPLLNKVTCCKNCSEDNTAKTSYDDKHCSVVFKDSTAVNQSCPTNNFLKSVTITQANTKLECCAPTLTGTVVQKANQLDDSCEALGISKDKCNADFVNEVKSRCKEYGTEFCNLTNLQNVEGKCNTYGMRYYDINENKYKNTDSYMSCHNDNFPKLDSYCHDKGMSQEQCNFYNIKDKPINDLQHDIINIDAIESSFEKKLSDVIEMLPSSNTARTFLVLCVCAFAIVIAILIYLLYNNYQK